MLWRPARRLLGRRALALRLFHSTHPSARKVLQRFKLADIGEGITECEVIKWTVAERGAVGAFEPLCEVQSDKASVEITSPYDGTIAEILVKEGEVAKVGADLCVIEVDEDAADAPAHQASAPDSHPAPAPATSTPTPAPATSTPTPAPASSPAPERRRHPMDPAQPAFAPATTAADVDVRALPAVRHFARQSGVDLALLAPGSGKGGRVEKADVERYLAGGQDLAGGGGEKVIGTADARAVEEEVVVELGRTRYGMWKAMTKSLEVPHFGYSTSLDLTSLHSLLPLLNSHIPSHYRPPTPAPPYPPAVSPSALYPPPPPPTVPGSGHYTKLTYLPILLKTLSKAMLEWPLFRASITPSPTPPAPNAKPTLTIRPHADICIALSTPTGLYTPVLKAADTHSAYALASQLKHLAHLGRQVPSALTPAELPRRGGTLTVSNVGALGAGEAAMPVLVPGGGVAIVALGRARWVWDVDRGDGSGERRLKMGVSWAADHRVVEGAELAAFVETWRGYVEHPERMIADGELT